MSVHTMDHWIDINGHDYRAETRYHYTPPRKGSWVDGYQVEPDEDAEIELGGIKIAAPGDGDWYVIPLTEELAEEILEEAWAHLKDGL